MLNALAAALAFTSLLQSGFGLPSPPLRRASNSSLPALPPPSGGVNVTGVADYHFDSAFDYESFVRGATKINRNLTFLTLGYRILSLQLNISSMTCSVMDSTAGTSPSGRPPASLQMTGELLNRYSIKAPYTILKLLDRILSAARGWPCDACGQTNGT